MSVIGSIVSTVPKVFNYGKRAVKVVPYVIMGNGAEVAINAVKNAPVKDAIKIGGKAVEEGMAKSFTTLVKENGKFIRKPIGFWQGSWNAIKNIPRSIGIYAKKGAVEAGVKGSSKLLGSVKGFFKGVGKNLPLLGKNLPLLGNLALVAFELPNIFKATKEQGIGQGVAEVAKASCRLTGASLGAAIGSAVLPGIGSLVGWVAGEWLTSKIVGKSYTEKVAEAEEQAQKLAQVQTLQQGQNPQVTFQGNNNYNVPTNGMANPFSGYNDTLNPYSNDIMMQQMNFNTLV